ncbi:ATP-dependent DNA helicase [Trichonephila clavipes]|nr:ATP-dependent DNA helicase [Trichonephila clavipes]
MSIKVLYITTKNSDKTFYICRRRSSSTIHLQEEFKRLSLNKLQTINEDFINFITNRQGLSIFTFNCQSLTAHAVDLQNSVIRNSNILVLSETWLGYESDISIPNFNCIVKNKRPNTRTGGVAIYQNSSDAVNIITLSMKCSVSQSDIYDTIQSSVGDLCLAQCVIDNGQKIIIVAVYITPYKKLDDIIEFLHRSLLPYTSRCSALLNKNYDKIPMILRVDFNVNFALDKSIQLIEFLKDNSTLSLQNNRIISTTKSNTTIDAVFSRYLSDIECKTYISYFNYPKPFKTKFFSSFSSLVSLSNGGAGIILLLPDGNNYKHKINTGIIASNFTSELVAIREALLLYQQNPHVIDSTEGLVIFSDSKSAIEAIRNGETNISCDIITLLEQLHNKRKSCILQWIPAHVNIEGNECADSLAKEARDIEHKCSTITLDDANAVAKHRIMNHTFKKPLVTEFDCPRIITSTIARLRTEHLKGMKIHPDKTRSYVQCKHCPDLQLTPNHILECPTVATKLLKMGMVPLRDSLRELLYSPDAPRIAEAVIKTFDGI